MQLDMEIISRIHENLCLKYSKDVKTIKSTLSLFDQGCTIHFVARYRKEITKSMDEVVLRDLQKDYKSLLNLESRRLTILKSIKEQDKLTPDLEEKIKNAETLVELEDLYLPFKPKRKNKALKAKEAGLEPLANLIFYEQPIEGNPEDIVDQYINKDKDIMDAKAAISGAKDIIIEQISENPEIRKVLREIIEDDTTLQSDKFYVVLDEDESNESLEETGERKEEQEFERESINEKIDKYKDYFDFKIPIRVLKPHQVLAINRGENEGILEVNLNIEDERYLGALKDDLIINKNGIFVKHLNNAIEKGYKKITRTLKRETWVKKILEAKSHAVKTFAKNLKNLLMQPPIKGKRIVAIDPGYRNGCKVAVIDQSGMYLDSAIIYPHPPKNQREKAIETLLELSRKHDAWTYAIGNGTASRETEELVSEIAHENDKLEYTIVSEAGASVYSASDIARQEFPNLDISIRGAISIGRRLQDPLSELIKIDPKSIGVGLYQHDVNQAELEEELNAVVEDCVNAVGVDVNTASEQLLCHVSGLNARVAKEIVKYRQENGPFKNREELKKVPYMGAKTFEQSIGFLRVYNGDNPLDTTFIHPESYHVAEKILEKMGMTPDDLLDAANLKLINQKLASEQIIAEFQDLAGIETLKDIIAAIKAPRRDPRDELPPVILKKDVLKLEDLQVGTVLKGTVRNVVDFGAFVDIGVKYNGLVHISQITNKFVKNPHEYLAVGDVIDVMVIDIDLPRKRIQLSIKAVNNSK
ncbi:MAG: Tex family protein [Promethearchaeota archaeon]